MRWSFGNGRRIISNYSYSCSGGYFIPNAINERTHFDLSSSAVSLRNIKRLILLQTEGQNQAHQHILHIVDISSSK